MTKLLIDDRPVMVLPKLAVAAGLAKAVILQQVHYWLKTFEEADKTNHFRDGCWWVYNTKEGWQKNFPWWSETLIWRELTELRECSLLIATNQYNAVGYDKTLWYTIDYRSLKSFEEFIERNARETLPVEQEKGKYKKMAKPILSEWQNPFYHFGKMDVTEMVIPIPETSTENNKKSNTETAPSLSEQQDEPQLSDQSPAQANPERNGANISPVNSQHPNTSPIPSPQQPHQNGQTSTSPFEADLDAESILAANKAQNGRGGAKIAPSIPSLDNPATHVQAQSAPTPATANRPMPTTKRQTPKHLRGFEAMNGNAQQDQIAQHLAQKLGGKPNQFVDVALEYNGIDDPLATLEKVVEVALFMRGACKPVAPKTLAADATEFVLEGYTLEQAKQIMAKDGRYRLEKKLRDDPYPSQTRTWLLSSGAQPALAIVEQGEASPLAVALHAKYAASGMHGSYMPESAKAVFRALGTKNPSERMRLTPEQIQSVMSADEDYGL